MITRRGKNMMTPNGIDIDFKRIRLRKKANRGKYLVARRCASSKAGRLDFCIRVDKSSTKPMVVVDRMCGGMGGSRGREDVLPCERFQVRRFQVPARLMRRRT